MFVGCFTRRCGIVASARFYCHACDLIKFVTTCTFDDELRKRFDVESRQSIGIIFHAVYNYSTGPQQKQSNLNGRIIRSGYEEIVGVEEHGPYTLDVARQSLDAPTAGNIPQLDRSVSTSGSQLFAIERYRQHSVTSGKFT